MVASTIANDVFMSALLFNAQTILSMRRICSVMGARAVVFATRTLVPITKLLVPITPFANLSDSWRSDSYEHAFFGVGKLPASDCIYILSSDTPRPAPFGHP